MSDLTDTLRGSQYICPITYGKEWKGKEKGKTKETMVKVVKEGMMTVFHQIENINKIYKL